MVSKPSSFEGQSCNWAVWIFCCCRVHRIVSPNDKDDGGRGEVFVDLVHLNVYIYGTFASCLASSAIGY